MPVLSPPRPDAMSPLLSSLVALDGVVNLGWSRGDTARCEGALALRGRHATAAAADQRLKRPRHRNARHKVTLKSPLPLWGQNQRVRPRASQPSSPSRHDYPSVLRVATLARERRHAEGAVTIPCRSWPYQPLRMRGSHTEMSIARIHPLWE